MGLLSFFSSNGHASDASRQDRPRVPGQSRGMLSRLRDAFMGWPGPEAALRSREGEYVQQEKAAAGPRGITFPWFLPYHDADHSGETSVMRQHYRRMFGSDPNVRSAVLGKLLGVAALKLTVQPADKKNAFDRHVADFVDWNLNQRFAGCIPALVWSVLSGALVDGYSVSEKVWTREEKGQWGGKWPLRDLKPKDTGNDLILQTDEFRNVTGVMGLRFNGGKEFSPADFLIFRHLPLFDSPTGASDLRSVYSRWWMLDTILKLLAIGVEKRAYPLLVGYWKSATEQPGLEGMLARAKWQNWLSAPESCKIEALNAAGSGNTESAAIIKDLKHDIFLGIRGAVLQNLEGTTTDARGDSQVHQSEAELFVWFLAECVTALLNNRDNGLIKDIVDLNFVVSEYPRATLGAVDVNEQKSRLDIFTGAHALGLDLSKEQVYEELNLKPPPLGEDEDCLPGGSGQAPPGGPLGGPGGPPRGKPFKEVETREYDDFNQFAESTFFGWGSLSEHEWNDFDESEWAHDPGPRSQNRWKNHKTGRVIYSPTNPGAALAARGGDKPASGTSTSTPAANHAPLHKQAVAKAKAVLSAFQQAYAKVMNRPVLRQVKAAGDAMTAQSKKLYAGLEQRYGRKTAVAVLASAQVIGWGALGVGAAIGVPLYLPGVSLWGSIPAAALAETYLQVTRGAKALGGLFTHDEGGTLSEREIKALARDMVAQLKAAFLEHVQANADKIRASLAEKDGARPFAEDAQGHEHKGKGEGGGQFTKGGGGGGEAEEHPNHKARLADSSDYRDAVNTWQDSKEAFEQKHGSWQETSDAHNAWKTAHEDWYERSERREQKKADIDGADPVGNADTDAGNVLAELSSPDWQDLREEVTAEKGGEEQAVEARKKQYLTQVDVLSAARLGEWDKAFGKDSLTREVLCGADKKVQAKWDKIVSKCKERLVRGCDKFRTAAKKFADLRESLDLAQKQQEENEPQEPEEPELEKPHRYSFDTDEEYEDARAEYDQEQKEYDVVYAAYEKDTAVWEKEGKALDRMEKVADKLSEKVDDEEGGLNTAWEDQRDYLVEEQDDILNTMIEAIDKEAENDQEPDKPAKPGDEPEFEDLDAPDPDDYEPDQEPDAEEPDEPDEDDAPAQHAEGTDVSALTVRGRRMPRRD